MLREVAERTGLFGAIDAVIPDPRDPRFIVHEQRALIARRIIAIALGYEDLNDHQALRDDPVLAPGFKARGPWHGDPLACEPAQPDSAISTAGLSGRMGAGRGSRRDFRRRKGISTRR
ncbi:transposase [Aquisphaera insulae]|uniref:transposase n=1 Tax=Aquisphaera insulae TaxID=2712864 RepID=UPI00196A6FD7